MSHILDVEWLKAQGFEKLTRRQDSRGVVSSNPAFWCQLTQSLWSQLWLLLGGECRTQSSEVQKTFKVSAEFWGQVLLYYTANTWLLWKFGGNWLLRSQLDTLTNADGSVQSSSSEGKGCFARCSEVCEFKSWQRHIVWPIRWHRVGLWLSSVGGAAVGECIQVLPE